MILWVVNLIDSVSMHPALYPVAVKVDIWYWTKHGTMVNGSRTVVCSVVKRKPERHFHTHGFCFTFQLSSQSWNRAIPVENSSATPTKWWPWIRIMTMTLHCTNKTRFYWDLLSLKLNHVSRVHRRGVRTKIALKNATKFQDMQLYFYRKKTSVRTICFML